MAKGQSSCINNEAILRAQLKYKESYRKYEETMQTDDVDQKYVDKKMKESGYSGHFFSIKYPDIDNSYVVFEHFPPTDPILYGKIMLEEDESAKKALLSLLPNYWFMIDDLPEGDEVPSQETVAEYVQLFYQYWFDMNRIDERQLNELLNGEKQSSEPVEVSQDTEINNVITT